MATGRSSRSRRRKSSLPAAKAPATVARKKASVSAAQANAVPTLPFQLAFSRARRRRTPGLKLVAPFGRRACTGPSSASRLCSRRISLALLRPDRPLEIGPASRDPRPAGHAPRDGPVTLRRPRPPRPRQWPRRTGPSSTIPRRCRKLGAQFDRVERVEDGQTRTRPPRPPGPAACREASDDGTSSGRNGPWYGRRNARSRPAGFGQLSAAPDLDQSGARGRKPAWPAKRRRTSARQSCWAPRPRPRARSSPARGRWKSLPHGHEPGRGARPRQARVQAGRAARLPGPAASPNSQPDACASG